MPDQKLTLYYCVSWCTHISSNSVRMLAGIVVATNRIGHARRITYTPKVTLTLCYPVPHGTRVTLTCVAPIASNIKCLALREILATIVTHAIGKRTQPNVNIILLC